VLLRVPACRTNLTMQQLAALFGISDSAVHRGTDRPAPHLAELPGPPPADRRERRIADGTLTPADARVRCSPVGTAEYLLGARRSKVEAREPRTACRAWLPAGLRESAAAPG
jgi:hypothetical protein